ncbi:MAG: hypothetical protein JSR78_07260 [Proteobacteria bacterium]|nr:hypothetical protein [Pseudomonadota bacterium]
MYVETASSAQAQTATTKIGFCSRFKAPEMRSEEILKAAIDVAQGLKRIAFANPAHVVLSSEDGEHLERILGNAAHCTNLYGDRDVYRVTTISGVEFRWILRQTKND